MSDSIAGPSPGSSSDAAASPSGPASTAAAAATSTSGSPSAPAAADTTPPAAAATPRAPSPGGKEGGKRILICLLRLDLRINDNALFHFAHMTAPPPGPVLHRSHFNPSKQTDADALHSQADYLLPLYVFDERSMELSGLPGYKRKGPEARTANYGFWKTGPFRTRFVSESVYDLRSRLRAVGSDLVIRFGIPEDVVSEMVREFQANGDEVEGVWLQKEMTHDEAQVEREIARKLEGTDVPLRFVHGKTLVHAADLPFEVSATPDVFTPFRKRVEALGADMVRPCYKAPERFKPVPPVIPEAGYRLDPDYEVDVDGTGISVPEAGEKKDGQVSFHDILRYLLAPISDPSSGQLPRSDNASAATLQQRHPASAFPLRGGESAALERLEWYFIRGKSNSQTDSAPPVSRYKQTRNNLIGHAYSTKMSPFLAYGSISPRQIWEALDYHEKKFSGEDRNTYWVRFELLWRDYFFWVAEKFGDLLFSLGGFEEATDPRQAEKKIADGWWKVWDPATDGRDHLVSRLLEGRTGIPFIDANVLELRESGFMSNRGRQNVASFLTKDLCYDWRIGAEFFQSHLIDYDATSNYGNWQYVAGVGNDPRAARQFSTIKQSKDYDSHGEYVKLWLPALRNLHPDYVHTPWLLSDDERRSYGIKTTVMEVSIDSYPGKPMYENEAWRKHYDRKEGVGSKMFGNPQEKIKDLRGGKRAGSAGKRTFVPRGLPQAPPYQSGPPLKLGARGPGSAGPPPDWHSGNGRGSMPPIGQRSSSPFGASGSRSGMSAPAPRPMPGGGGFPRPPMGPPHHIVGPPPIGGGPIGGPIGRNPVPMAGFPPALRPSSGFVQGPASTPTGIYGHPLPPQPLPGQYAHMPPQQQMQHHPSRPVMEGQMQPMPPPSQSQASRADNELSWRRGGSKPPSAGA